MSAVAGPGRILAAVRTPVTADVRGGRSGRAAAFGTVEGDGARSGAAAAVASRTVAVVRKRPDVPEAIGSCDGGRAR
ncbi:MULTISPECIES: hypothetical protein [Amycolatopsis]|uniref:Uncharacterized protein n=1 Tax=Amycolatopsis dendrobii TaxID=2760662 RepID=A0A7W3W3Y4_9PSEU|nr:MULTISPECIES: hypothetical protein [Amycolatopsis]MBB1158328.1 hypothetical protein [Amycolatopsis dendrobii]UKD56829.1 hypothetical protein L3Q65_08940 [Amycolatopsis sp. FU40]